ncbi:MAG: endolytic transglycosylase MltG, partial [Acidimicrobiia bacterium]|nr:endolytic transglycosylase MltG [Acidimicrobiia bacterium]
MTFPDQQGNRFSLHPAVIWLLKFGAVVVTVLVVAVFGAKLARDLAERFPAEVAEAPTQVGEAELTIPSGASARTIGALLEDRGLIEDGGEFEREVRRRNVADDLKAGEYIIAGGTLDELIAILIAGPDPTDVFRLTVIEGLTISAMLNSIADQTDHTRAELEEALLSGDVTSVLLPEQAPAGLPEVTRWEGLLAPDTYEFRSDASAVAILSRLADTLVTRLDDQDWTLVEEAGFTPYEGLIVASMIEREAKLDEDRPLIASVIMNRLDAGIGLQIDATVLYALGEVRTLTTADLEVDSLYNTYKWAGLPPTPIAGVRLASLEAAA